MTCRCPAGRASAIALGLILSLGGCQFPRDVDGTLARVRGGHMRVGVVESDPWATLTAGHPDGVEVELVKRFARRLRAKVKWVPGSESELMTALHGVQLDLVSGLTRASEWKRKVTLTRPYVTTEIVLAAPPGTEVPDDLDGVRVGVEEHSAAATELERQTDADPVPVPRLEDFPGPVAVTTTSSTTSGWSGPTAASRRTSMSWRSLTARTRG